MPNVQCVKKVRSYSNEPDGLARSPQSATDRHGAINSVTDRSTGNALDMRERAL